MTNEQAKHLLKFCDIQYDINTKQADVNTQILRMLGEMTNEIMFLRKELEDVKHKEDQE